MDTMNVLYLVGSVLLFVSILTSTLSARLGVPLLLFFLSVGMLAGEEGVLGITFAEYGLANFIGQAALACILFDGGLRTSVSSFRVGLRPAIVLATWGVLASVLGLGIFATYLLDVDWRFGLLIAAIVGSTDAAAVFSLLRNGGIKLNDRVQATLEIESGANDPLAILLVTVLIALNLDPDSQSIWDILQMLGAQVLVGILAGYVSGKLIARLMPKLHLADGMYAILMMSAGFMVFSITNLLGGSGFLAVYLAGILIGNNRVRATERALMAMDSFAWLSQAVLFVILGLLVTPSELLNVWHYGLILFLFMLFIARPLAVYTSLFPFGFHPREVGFISWVGLRGAVPITLAIMPVMMGVPNSELAFNLTFTLVILSLLVQGASLPLMAKWFSVTVPSENDPKALHEIWVGGEARVKLHEFEVQNGAFAIGQHPDALTHRAQTRAKIFAWVRDDKLLLVDDTLRLKASDSVWYQVIEGEADIKALAHFFNNSAVSYKKDSEFYGDWVISPHVKVANLPFFAAKSTQDAPVLSKMQGLDDVLIKRLWAYQGRTMGDFLQQKLGHAPVVGDSLSLNEHWSVIVKRLDDKGNILALGLKRRHKES